jgi:FMN phosphatase YigB (HAD superfamily)
MIKAIVFDLGGVIYTIDFSKGDFFKNIREFWNKAKVSEIDNDEFLNLCSEKLGTSVEEVKGFIWDNNDLVSEMKDLVLELKEKYKIGFLANLVEEVYNSDISLWNFEEAGESVMSFKEKVKKPDFEAIDLTIEKLGVNKEEIIFIDDSGKTIETYSAHGVKCIRFDNKDQLIEDLKKFGVEA